MDHTLEGTANCEKLCSPKLVGRAVSTGKGLWFGLLFFGFLTINLILLLISLHLCLVSFLILLGTFRRPFANCVCLHLLYFLFSPILRCNLDLGLRLGLCFWVHACFGGPLTLSTLNLFTLTFVGSNSGLDFLFRLQLGRRCLCSRSFQTGAINRGLRRLLCFSVAFGIPTYCTLLLWFLRCFILSKVVGWDWFLRL